MCVNVCVFHLLGVVGELVCVSELPLCLHPLFSIPSYSLCIDPTAS